MSSVRSLLGCSKPTTVTKQGPLYIGALYPRHGNLVAKGQFQRRLIFNIILRELLCRAIKPGPH